MSSNRVIRPIIDPHNHYDQLFSYNNYYSNGDGHVQWEMNLLYPPTEDNHNMPLNSVNNNMNNILNRVAMTRRLSTPQMGYYDLITGEYRYRSVDNGVSNTNYNNPSQHLSNYAGETEPPMCENTCKCCQIKVPFNCLTICLITSLMLLMMFSMFKMLLGSKPKNIANMNLFQDMIWLMASFTLFFLSLIVLKYSCWKQSSEIVSSHCSAPCAKCKLMKTFRTNSNNDRYKDEIVYGTERYPQPNDDHHNNDNTGEDFV